MARASRSSKKQPDFDPSELEDLIFSPAVGKGVGSHLVSPGNMTTVVTPYQGPVVTSSPPDLATVDASLDVASMPHLATVVERESANFGGVSTVVPPDVTTVPAAAISGHAAQLWITEHGDLVSEARVKRIRLAQDVINSAEESVYDTLWNAKLLGTDDRDGCRMVQAGYDYLVKRTRLSRKTIQRIVAKLLEKDFIAVETRADIYQRAATVYRVFSYKAVLEKHVKKGRTHVAKMGPGFSYARQLETATQPSVGQPDITTVDTSQGATMVDSRMTTVAKPTTVTVVKTDRPTVVKMSAHLLDSKLLDKNSSSSLPKVRAALASYGRVDDDVATQLLAACRSYAPDCTEEEIVHFIHEKGRFVQRRESRVHNPLGFLLTAVPKCFSSDVLEEYRAEQSRALEAKELPASAEEDPALARWRREQEAALSDPSVSDQEKHLIRLCLGLNSG